MENFLGNLAEWMQQLQKLPEWLWTERARFFPWMGSIAAAAVVILFKDWLLGILRRLIKILRPARSAPPPAEQSGTDISVSEHGIAARTVTANAEGGAAIINTGGAANVTVHHPGRFAPKEPNLLGLWKDAAKEEYERMLATEPHDTWPTPLENNLIQFSYWIHTAGGQAMPIPRNYLFSVALEADAEVKNTLPQRSWPLFFPITRQDIKPYTTVVEAEGRSFEALEAKMLSDTHAAGERDFWRISNNGLATIIRGYLEDEIAPEALLRHKEIKKQPGEWLDVSRRARDVAELVLHAEAMLKRFPDADSIEYECVYTGLRNRLLITESPYTKYDNYVSQADGRRITVHKAIVAVRDNWEEIVLELLNPVLGFFDGYEIQDKAMLRRLLHVE